MNRKVFLGLAAALAAAAVILAVTGGFRTTVGGLRMSARSPIPIALLAFTNLSTWLLAARRAQAIHADLEAAWRWCDRHSRSVAALALVSVLVASIFATRSAAGADASGYLSEAAMLMEGRLFHDDDLAALARGHDPYLTSPLGWQPAPPERQAPTYAPGLPMLMAIPHALAGVRGAAAVVIASAAVVVLATGLLASQLGGSAAGVIAAALITFTPIFLHQSIQPMSDVPVTAAWILCFLLIYRRHPLRAGLACALAVLIRPNLAPLALVPFVAAGKPFDFAQGKPFDSAQGKLPSAATLMSRLLRFATPVALAGVVLAVLQWRWYGSPFRSGYGSADELFAIANVGANASRYFVWLVESSPVLLLSVLGFARLKTERFAQALLAFTVLVVAAYLIYAVFDDWSYLRFLLPALVVLTLFTAVALAAWIERSPMAARAPLLFAVVLAVTAHGLWVARSHDTFKLADQLRRVELVADFIRDRVEASAVIVAGEQSGSMRYYTGRPILRWEAASPDALGAAIQTLEQQGRPVWIVLDAWENERFLAKFAAVKPVALDWPAVLIAGTTHRTGLWRLSDRARFLRGEPVDTVRTR